MGYEASGAFDNWSEADAPTLRDSIVAHRRPVADFALTRVKLPSRRLTG
jgi:hypothetical protein